MAKEIRYTTDQIEILKQNPYTHSVTPYTLSFTVAFKQFFYEQTKVPGMTTRKILRAAGYDTAMFTQEQMSKIRSGILKQAKSEEGFRTWGRSAEEKAREFAQKDLEKQDTKKAIREMQEQIVRLEAQIAFLKKISHIREQQNGR